MIAQLRGMLLEKGTESVLVEVGGLGYEVYVPALALAQMPAPGREVRLYTHFHVREDAQVLYGFLNPEDRKVFLLLLTVKGVGPKVALGMLSHLSSPALAEALVQRDLAALTRLPGVGKKLAERLGVELSDKAKALAAASGGLGTEAPSAGPWDAALAALTALGYPRQQARGAVEAAFKALGRDAASLEAIVKEALKAV